VSNILASLDDDRIYAVSLFLTCFLDVVLEKRRGVSDIAIICLVKKIFSILKMYVTLFFRNVKEK
jgi:hypothetical protein